MSTEATPQNPDKLSAAIAEVRSDDLGFDRQTWILVGHVDNNPNQIDVVDHDVSADAKMEDFNAKLQDDQVMYGLLRLTTTVDMSKNVRFVYVHW